MSGDMETDTTMGGSSSSHSQANPGLEPRIGTDLAGDTSFHAARDLARAMRDTQATFVQVGLPEALLQEFEEFCCQAERVANLTNPRLVHLDEFGSVAWNSRQERPETPRHAIRSRLDVTSASTTPVARHHDTLYIPDGNIILEAPTSEGEHIRFRVHRSLLCFQSPVIANLFASVLESGDICDGLPLVKMKENATDLECLLKSLYDPSALPYKRLDPETPTRVYGVLSLATRYRMDALRARIIDQVEGDWPQSLSAWDRSISAVEETQHESEDHLSYLDDMFPEPASAVRLALDFDIPKILPAALYRLHTIRPSCDWERYRLPELEQNAGALLQGERTAKWHLLEKTHFMQLLHFKEYLETFIIEDMVLSSASACKRSARCGAGRRLVRMLCLADPLAWMMVSMKMGAQNVQLLCQPCLDELLSSAPRCREAIWNHISNFKVSTGAASYVTFVHETPKQPFNYRMLREKEHYNS